MSGPVDGDAPVSRGEFVVADGVLSAISAEGVTLWSRRPDGRPVKKVENAPAGESAFVLLEWTGGWQQDQNLLRIGRDGSVIWRAQLPPAAPADCFVDIRLESDGALIAWTWSGWMVRVSQDTGAIGSREFTK